MKVTSFLILMVLEGIRKTIASLGKWLLMVKLCSFQSNFSAVTGTKSPESEED
jgi:hypothetical protein